MTDAKTKGTAIYKQWLLAVKLEIKKPQIGNR